MGEIVKKWVNGEILGKMGKMVEKRETGFEKLAIGGSGENGEKRGKW